MLDQSTRAAILKLREQGHSIRSIARALKVSRGAVRDVLRSATEQVPTLVRPEKATPYRDQILELYVRCKGNLVRVHEELVASGAQLSYQALTAFCQLRALATNRRNPSGSIALAPARRCRMTPPRTVPRSAAAYSLYRRPRWSAPIPECSSFSFSPASHASIARSSSPTPFIIFREPAKLA